MKLGFPIPPQNVSEEIVVCFRETRGRVSGLGILVSGIMTNYDLIMTIQTSLNILYFFQKFSTP